MDRTSGFYPLNPGSSPGGCSKFMRTPEQKLRIRNLQRQYRAEGKEWKVEYLSSHPCVDCGESDIRCLDFDHITGIKFANISVLIRRGQTLKKILSEVAKCVVRCANCHRKRTYDMQAWPRSVVDSAILS